MTLSPEQIAHLREGLRVAAKVRRARSVARFNGWCAAIFAAFALAFGLVSTVSLLVGVGLAIVAFNEFRGAKRIERLDRRAPVLLAANQGLLLAVLVAYCAFSLHAALTGPSLSEQVGAVDASAASTLESLDSLQALIATLVYGGVAAGSLVVQSLTAWWYLSRRKWIDRFQTETPSWVRDADALRAA